MMGFADFPVEILRALRIKPSENSVDAESSCQRLEVSSPSNSHAD